MSQSFSSRPGTLPSARCWVLVGLLCSLVACGDQERVWSEPDTRMIYEATFVALQEVLDEPDDLFIDPRPRFLVEEEEGVFRMGDFNRYGDPTLTQAIRDVPSAASCEIDPDRGCSRVSHLRFIEISEIMPLSPRDAGVLAVHVDLGTTSVGVRGFVFSLRHADDDWRVVRVDRGSSAEIRR